MTDETTKHRSERSQGLYRRRLETMVRAVLGATVAVPLLLGAIDAFAQRSPHRDCLLREYDHR
jgi:hypothetical protein